MQNSYMREDIEDAFLILAKEKAFDKITVTKIVQTCGISRQTFYYYFQDVMEVAECALGWQIEKVTEQCRMCTQAKEAILIFVTCIRENRNIIKNMYESKQKEKLIQMMILNLEQILEQMLVNIDENQKFNKEEYSKLKDFYTYGLLGFILKKVVENDIDVLEITDQIEQILKINMGLFLKKED